MRSGLGACARVRFILCVFVFGAFAICEIFVVSIEFGDGSINLAVIFAGNNNQITDIHRGTEGRLT